MREQAENLEEGNNALQRETIALKEQVKKLEKDKNTLLKENALREQVVVLREEKNTLQEEKIALMEQLEKLKVRITSCRRRRSSPSRLKPQKSKARSQRD
jgi:chromosome segregation ATPase